MYRSGEFLSANWRKYLISCGSGVKYLAHRNAGRPRIDPDHACRLRSLPPAGSGAFGNNSSIGKDSNDVTFAPSYDILKKDAAALVWVQAMDDLELAKLRIRELAARSDGEYVIFDQRTRQIVDRFTSRASV